MSDFLKSLSSRSFGLEDGPESVQPRLPSLFEMPRASWGVPQDEAVTETPETAAVQNESAPGSLDSHHRATGHPAARQEESETATPFVNRSSGFNAKSSSYSAPDLSPIPRGAASPGIRPGRYADAEAASRTHQETTTPSMQSTRLDAGLPVSERERLPETESASFPGFKSSLPITNGPKPDQKAADTEAFPIPGFKSPIQTTTGPEPDHKFADRELFQNKSPVLNVQKIKPAEVRPKTMQSDSLVADMSVFERRVMDKISSHTETHTSIDGRLSNTDSKQRNILPLTDPLLSVKWPNLQPAIQGQENKALSSGNEPAPTIQVTIGRIEIRATPPTSTARKNTEKKPSAMSLEEYLNKRNGGVR